MESILNNFWSYFNTEISTRLLPEGNGMLNKKIGEGVELDGLFPVGLVLIYNE